MLDKTYVTRKSMYNHSNTQNTRHATGKVIRKGGWWRVRVLTEENLNGCEWGVVEDCFPVLYMFTSKANILFLYVEGSTC